MPPNSKFRTPRLYRKWSACAIHERTYKRSEFGRACGCSGDGWLSLRLVLAEEVSGLLFLGGFGGFRFRFGRRGHSRVLRSFRLKEFRGIQERPAHRRVIARPGSVDLGLTFEMRPHGLHLGIEIVEVMEHECFRKHRQFGRPELVLYVMADDEMFEQG